MTPTTQDLIRDLAGADEATRRYAAEDLAAAPDPAAVPAEVLMPSLRATG